LLGARWKTNQNDASLMEPQLRAVAGTVAIKTGVKID
jgi:hypothetical protein